MSDRLANFGRRAKRLVQGPDASTSDPSASAWQPRDPSARPSSLTHLGATAEQPDIVEETVLNEELSPTAGAGEGAGAEAVGGEQLQKRSAFPQAKGRGRAISAAPGRARTRGEGNAGWNVRTLETSPKRGTAQLKDAVKDKVKGILQRNGSADSNDSSDDSGKSSPSSDPDAREKSKPAKASKHSLQSKDPATSALDTIESATEDPVPSSLRGSGSLTNASRSGLTASTFSSSALHSGGSTLSYLARPALQALAALDEPDSTADLTLPWSGSMNIGGGASGTSSYTSLRARQRELDRQDGEKEAVDIQLLASAALSGCSVVMGEADGPWVWSGVMAEVGDLLRMEPMQVSKEVGATSGKEGMVGAALGGANVAGTGRNRGMVAR